MASPPLDTIWFYNKGEPYYEFTNFYEAPVFIDGTRWSTTEHYYQASKFRDYPAVQKQIWEAPYPSVAFKIARENQALVRSDWTTVNVAIMRRALYCKFSQHQALAKTLLDTKFQTLVEHTTKDKFWGDGGDGSGQNRLGKLLMDLRTELRKFLS